MRQRKPASAARAWWPPTSDSSTTKAPKRLRRSPSRRRDRSTPSTAAQVEEQQDPHHLAAEHCHHVAEGCSRHRQHQPRLAGRISRGRQTSRARSSASRWSAWWRRCRRCRHRAAHDRDTRSVPRPAHRSRAKPARRGGGAAHCRLRQHPAAVRVSFRHPAMPLIIRCSRKSTSSPTQEPLSPAALPISKTAPAFRGRHAQPALSRNQAVDRRAAARHPAFIKGGALRRPGRWRTIYRRACPPCASRLRRGWRAAMASKASIRIPRSCRSTARASAVCVRADRHRPLGRQGAGRVPLVVSPNPFYQIYEGAPIWPVPSRASSTRCRERLCPRSGFAAGCRLGARATDVRLLAGQPDRQGARSRRLEEALSRFPTNMAS